MTGSPAVPDDVAPRQRPGFVAFVAHIPATISLIGIILASGIIWGGLWSPFEQSPTFDVVAYGLPALEAGRWWTPVTGTFFVVLPWVYVPTILSFAGMAYLEWRRGWRVALAYFTIGQLFAVLASSLLFLVLARLPWNWAITEAAALDVGASGGTMACLAAAIGLLRQPWRVRAWLVLLAFVGIAVLYWGELADVEHLLAVVLVLSVDRSLKVRRTTVREQRLLAVVGITFLVALEIVTLLVPTDGMFGPTEPADGGFVDVAIDLLVLILIGRGLLRGRRWAWIISLILAAINLLSGIVVVIFIVLVSESVVEGTLDSETELAVASSVLWTAFAIYLLRVGGAFRSRRKSPLGDQPTPALSEVKEALHSHGGGTLSWMSTWDGNEYARVGDSILTYQRRNGVALVLADPIGPAGSRAKAVTDFISMAEDAGLVPCFFSSDEETKKAVPPTWRSIVVADDTIVDLEGLAFTGKRWSSVRTSLNRAGRENMTFRMTTLGEETWGVRQQLRAISEMWVGDKGLPEMGFTLGTLDEAADPEVRLALALSPEGDVDGFLSWLPVYGADGQARGWTLDLMRRRDGGFAPVMEFLIGSSAKLFSEEGAQIMSLSGAPLAHDYPADAGMIAALSKKLADALEPVYGFASLHRFKQKFHPRYETMYLLFRDEADLTRVGGALTRAFLPDATVRQFAGAGFELLRGEKD
ncbi:DUF2156 domain-containing protein [Microbacterium marmarense]|uniref:DUF2156 domain-containing protein n=1 Tax=Microbacterium marmarense TaxID=3122051 RepID=A0ABU8LRL6_9MICO